MRKKLINKVAKKKSIGHCYFCKNNDYVQLQVHRINFEAAINEYTDFNTIVVCANCHCRIHDGQIKIDRKYYSTSGKYVLHYWINEGENTKEFWE